MANNEVYGRIFKNTKFITDKKIDAKVDGKKIELKNNIDGEPMVEYDGKTYKLNWMDIVHLAKDKGLFDEDTGANNDNRS